MDNQPFTKHEFDLPQGKLTSLVMSDVSFNEFCDAVAEAPFPGVKDVAEACRTEGHVKMIARGTKTEYLFKKYEVTSQFLTACRRGFADKKMEGLINVPQQEAIEKLEGYLATLPEETQIQIKDSAKTLLEEVKKGLTVTLVSVVLKVCYKIAPDIPRSERLKYAEECCLSIVQTMTNWAQMGDPFTQDVEGYLRRIVTGMAASNDMWKGQKYDDRN